MRFVYSVSVIRSFYNSAVEPIFCSAIQNFNAENSGVKALEVSMTAFSIERLLRCERLSGASRALLVRFIDNVISRSSDASAVFDHFREMVTARR